MEEAWLDHVEAARSIGQSINLVQFNRHCCLANSIERVIAIGGAAGLGKTTLSTSLRLFFESNGASSTHVQLDGLLYPRKIRQQLGVNGYQLQGWEHTIAEKLLRSMLCDGNTIHIPEYLPDGSHGVEHTLSPASYMLLDGNYSLLGPISELVDTLIVLDADIDVLECLRYDRDVVKEGRFTPDEERRVWTAELDALERNIRVKRHSAHFLVTVNRRREYRITVQK